VRRSVEKVLTAEVATFELVVKVPPRNNSGDSLLYRLYNRMDRSIFTALPNALEPTCIDDLVESVPSLSSDESERIKDFRLDVLINFGPAELSSRFAPLAKYGVWFYDFGAMEESRQNARHVSLPGFREVMNSDPITVSSLRSLHGQPPREQIIYQSVSPTLSKFSIGANTNACYWKSAAFVARSLVELYSGAHDDKFESNNRSEAPMELPTNTEMGQMLVKLSRRVAWRALEKLSTFEQWILAYRISQTDFKYLIPPVDRFWADPFPIQAGGKYYIFFEEYLRRTGKAHISVIEVDQIGIAGGPTEVLHLDCHLSYPFVFEWRGDYYMIPEMGDKNVVELYRSHSFPFDWRLEKVLLQAKVPLDATLVEVNGLWWMFVNIQEEGVGVNWDELHLYYADNPLGPWKPHARNPVVSDVRSARPAGRLFWSDNVLYRPSQDSSLRYGYALNLNKINSISPTEYSETQVSKILPDWDKDIVGVHTLNTFNQITVVDCLTRRKRFRSNNFRPLPGLGATEDFLRYRTERGSAGSILLSTD
jgi:hypothetical protein